MTSFGDISDLGLMSRLHKAVSNPHLVKLFSHFEDPNFVYIVLELCRFFSIPQEYTTRRITRNGNLVELLKRRKASKNKFITRADLELDDPLNGY